MTSFSMEILLGNGELGKKTWAGDPVGGN